MTEQKEIADVVLDTPEPDRWVDCGESRPLPMFHMHTLMQYGERCAEAALAWLRSQEKKLTCGHPDSLLLRSAETDQPLYCELCDAQSARRDAESMEAGMRAELDALRGQAPVAWMNAKKDMTYFGHYNPDDVPLYAAPQPAIPDGWREAIESISEFGDDTLCDEALHAIHASRENTEEALRIAVRLTKEEAIEKLEKLAAVPEPSK